MREIKFRGYDEENKCWRYGHLFETVEGIGRCYNIVEGREVKYYVSPESIGQFTGLHDKNGKEIYEGDILQINYDKMFINQKEKHSKHFIKWDEDYGSFVMIGIDIKTEEGNPSKNGLNKKWVENFGEYFEIIGNMHQNPELTK